ncbi:MAG TPA: RDD family protein [Kiritimatiellia bacterium]|nr:RDD family protein [Kiritimatiellia bacterium]
MLTYYAQDDRQVGPLDDVSFERLVANGTITGETLVWNERMPDWLPYREARASGFFDAPATGPLHATEVSEEGPGPEPVVAEVAVGLSIAGVGVRAIAFLIDFLVLYAINFVIQAGMVADLPPIESIEDLANALGPLMAVSLVQLAVGILYTTFFLGKFGATPGKMVFGLAVVTAEGEAVTYGRAAGRALAEILSAMLFYIGYLLAFFDPEQRRTLHDRICDTRVVYRGSRS